MKIFLALALAAASSNLAFAEVPCGGGSPNIFKFVKWDFTTIGPEIEITGMVPTTKVTLTVHNETDHNFKDAEIKVRWGEWHQFFFKLKTLAKANSDTTFINSFGMSGKDAKMLQTITPTLCTEETHDESGNEKSYE